MRWRMFHIFNEMTFIDQITISVGENLRCNKMKRRNFNGVQLLIITTHLPEEPELNDEYRSTNEER